MPSVTDFQVGIANGYFVPEASSGINGATADTNGNSLSLSGSVAFPQPFRMVTAVLRTTGTFTAGKFLIQASLDGTTWVEMQIVNGTTGVAIAAGGFTLGAAATTLFTNALLDMPVRFVRAVLTGGSTGGTGAFVSLLLGGE